MEGGGRGQFFGDFGHILHIERFRSGLVRFCYVDAPQIMNVSIYNLEERKQAHSFGGVFLLILLYMRCHKIDYLEIFK